MPGMQVEVDILTGKKSVLAYFMKPFTRALENAMTEH
jgi:adhesin transport system membrane fusion protein